MGGRLGEHICNLKNQQGINLENTRDSYESTRNKNEYSRKIGKGYDNTIQRKERWKDKSI